MRPTATPFESFYAAYRAKHAHPVNRALHLLAKVFALGALSVAFAGQSECVSRPPRLAWWTALKRACAPNGDTLLVLLSLAATAGTW